MEIIQRIINVALPKGQSVFLWGPRKVGKSTFLKCNFPDSLYYDFLKTDLYFKFLSTPSLLREELLYKEKNILKKPIILDEVQKIPKILDEVHWLIENKELSFILCGSNARKLKHNHANLLGGRAWRIEMFPFVTAEIENFDLLKCLNQGMIPSHYLSKKYSNRSLKAYVQDYLKTEIFEEGLIRNIPAFSRFFDAIAYSHGELINYSNIARDCGVSSKTVKEYFQILVDTHLCTLIEPYKRNQTRQVILSAPKFYLFDVGVANNIIEREIKKEKGSEFGKTFEHFVFTELKAYISYREKNYDIKFWRTKTGLEVDFIIDKGNIAIEVKGTNRVDKSDLKGIIAFKNDNNPKKSIVVSNEKSERMYQGIKIIPWQIFLKKMWSGKII